MTASGKLIWIAGIVCVLAIGGTAVWFVREQRSLQVLMERRKELREAVESAEEALSSKDPAETLRLIQRAFALEGADILNGEESLRNRLDLLRERSPAINARVAAKQAEKDRAAWIAELKQQVSSSVQRLQSTLDPTRFKFPATGLQASNPAAAKKAIDDFQAMVEERIHSDYVILIPLLRSGDSDGALKFLNGLEVANDISIAEYKRMLELVATLGSPERMPKNSDELAMASTFCAGAVAEVQEAYRKKGREAFKLSDQDVAACMRPLEDFASENNQAWQRALQAAKPKPPEDPNNGR